MKLKILIPLGLAVAGLGVAIVVITRPWEILSVRAETRTILTIANPVDESVVPVHASVPVIASAHSRSGIRQLSLYVNDQLWGERTYSGDLQLTQETWQWTPSGEGLHRLRLQLLTGLGEMVESQVTTVIATLSADVRFPFDYTSAGGETLETLAQQFQTDQEAVARSNSDVNFDTPLMPGLSLVIPVPVSNGPLTGPESGVAPIPPLSLGSGGPPGAGGPGSPGVDPGAGAGEESPGQGEGGNQSDAVPVSLSQLDLPISPGFEIHQGNLIPGYPVERLYLYVSIAGGAWQRIPGEDQSFLDPSPAGFDVTDHFPIPEGAELFEPIPYIAQAWGWIGSQLLYLGEQTGVYMLDLSGFPFAIMTQTQLQIIGRIRDEVEYVSEWTIPEPIPDYYQGFVQGFRWSSAKDGVTGGLYQVSLQPYDPSAGLFPPGLLMGKLIAGPKTITQKSPFPWLEDQIKVKPATFAIDFSQFLDLPQEEEDDKSFFDAISDAINDALDSLQASVGSTQQLAIGGAQDLQLSSQAQLQWGPQTFYVRVIPIVNKKFDMEASNTVIVRYGPPEVESITSELGGAYEVEVVSFTPYRSADSNYATCVVATVDIKMCTSNTGLYQTTGQLPDPVCTTIWPKGTLSCGCPGVNCGSSGGGCGWDPFCHVGNWFEAGANALEGFVKAVVSAYNDFKDTVVGFVADLGCAAFSGDAKNVCKGLVNLGVNIALTSMGIPPELPDFEKLMDQGLEYAFETAVSQLTGCDTTCQAAIKKGLEILADPEKALDEGLNIGVEFAKEQLEKQGVPCDSFCQDLMKNAAKGEIDTGMVLDEALDEAAEQAANYLKSQGHTCDNACEALIKAQLQKGANSLNLGQSGLPKGQELNWWEPHPLAVEQPATMIVRVTRRPESAAVPAEHLEGCWLSIYNQASNVYVGQTISGKLFEGVGLGIPSLQPGDALTIPIVLKRAPWYLPASFSPVASQEDGVVYATLSDIVYGEWTALYYGSTATFNLTGNNYLTSDDQGSTIGLPCVEPASWSRDMPNLP